VFFDAASLPKGRGAVARTDFFVLYSVFKERPPFEKGL